MNPNEYVKNVLVTESRDFGPIQQRLNEIRNIRLIHACAGISSELAELIQLSEEVEEKIDRVNLMEELGDILWYIGVASDALGAVDDIAGETPYSGVKMDDTDLHESIDAFISAVGEISGLLVDKAIKKNIFYGKPFNAQPIIEHLRHIHQNVKYLLENAGYTLEQARERNIAKLKARYGEKFTEAAALERNLAAERAILEEKTTP